MANVLPDAPWIVDAETNGAESAPDVYCDYCGAENPDCFYIQDGMVVGCSFCQKAVDPWEWLADHKPEWEG